METLTSHSFALSADGAALVLRNIGSYGVITIETLLSRPEAKACWLAATLELEESALQVCKQRGGSLVKLLSPERVTAAIGRFRGRTSTIKDMERTPWLLKMFRSANLDAYFGKIDRDMGSDLSSLLIDYTQFADKKAMLLKGEIDLQMSKTKIKAVFERARSFETGVRIPPLNVNCESTTLGISEF